jgi:hypothetical protein
MHLPAVLIVSHDVAKSCLPRSGRTYGFLEVLQEHVCLLFLRSVGAGGHGGVGGQHWPKELLRAVRGHGCGAACGEQRSAV